jgi:DNA-binding transcriptional regulator YiaG
MPNIAKVLKDEFARLAKKEMKAIAASLKKDVVALKRAAADQKRRLAKVERDNGRLLRFVEKAREKSVQVSSEEVASARITAKMIRSIRRRLGLSQAEFAQLAGVSSVSVFQWEHKAGRLTFRGDSKANIVAVRKMSKIEARKKLDEMQR